MIQWNGGNSVPYRPLIRPYPPTGASGASRGRVRCRVGGTGGQRLDGLGCQAGFGWVSPRSAGGEREKTRWAVSGAALGPLDIPSALGAGLFSPTTLSGQMREPHAKRVKISLLTRIGYTFSLGFRYILPVASALLKERQIRLTAWTVLVVFAVCLPKQ
jgi:hypothetical protein